MDIDSMFCKVMYALLSALRSDEQGSLSPLLLGECACCGEPLLAAADFGIPTALKKAIRNLAVSSCFLWPFGSCRELKIGPTGDNVGSETHFKSNKCQTRSARERWSWSTNIPATTRLILHCPQPTRTPQSGAGVGALRAVIQVVKGGDTRDKFCLCNTFPPLNLLFTPLLLPCRHHLWRNRIFHLFTFF